MVKAPFYDEFAGRYNQGFQVGGEYWLLEFRGELFNIPSAPVALVPPAPNFSRDISWIDTFAGVEELVDAGDLKEDVIF
tara:strand:+ start:318 stop:554 length:237 start_codon:yes stop_codon:yes gene_type:complete